MAEVTTNGTGLGTALTSLLMAPDIEPGTDASYQLCKDLYVYHPLGKKLVDTPIILAQSQPRDIAVPDAPDRVRETFLAQWDKDGVDGHIFNVGSLSRMYGIAAIGLLIRDVDPNEAIDFAKLADQEITFNAWDPLNMAGSLVLDLDPNSFNFLKPTGVRVQGKTYHPSRVAVKMNEKPIYLSYTTSAYGFSGRSVFQRTLFALKSFIDTMTTDAMVARKAGLIVAKMIPPGGIVDRVKQAWSGVKRVMIQWGRTENVLGITPGEEIETLNMQNADTCMTVARKNILDNVATGADMPAIILNQETFAEGFGEGIEDAKSVARYIGGVRTDLKPVYDWFDPIIMHRAWSPAFYKSIQAEFPEQYGSVSYNEALYQWKNAFKPSWPSLIEEPESEAVKVADVKLKSIIATVQVFGPELPDQENKATLLAWAQDNINSDEVMFTTPLNLDFEAVANYVPPAPVAGEDPEGKEPEEPRPFAAADSSDPTTRLRRLVRSQPRQLEAAE